MKVLKDFKNLVILILLLLVVAQYFWPKGAEEFDKSKYIEIGGKEYKILEERSETKYIPISSKGISYTPSQPIIINEPRAIINNIPIDTAAVIDDYFTKKYYEDIQPIDSLGTVKIMDTVFGNEIIARQLQFDYELPVVTNTITALAPPKTQMYIGGGLGTSNIYGSVLLKTKKDKLFGINVGAVNMNNVATPYIGGAIYWKIKLRRNK